MMRSFLFKKIDAFATARSSGNPAGYVLLNSADDMAEADMLQLAKELKGFVNEVGYVYKSAGNQLVMRYYSAEREVDFCGHATVAITYDLLSTDVSLQHYETLQITTNRGLIHVENRLENENAVFVFSPEPFEKESTPAIKDIATYLKIRPEQIKTDLPISVINVGLSTLIVPVSDLESILSISPDLDQLNGFCVEAGVDIIHVFTAETADQSNNFRARVFAPTFGYIEDPATGSGNSAFGYYLLKNNLWKDETIRIEQNGLRDNFNVTLPEYFSIALIIR